MLPEFIVVGTARETVKAVVAAVVSANAVPNSFMLVLISLIDEDKDVI